MVGYIRMEKKNKFFYVSWAILKKYQKMGFAKKSLNLATKNKMYRPAGCPNNIFSFFNSNGFDDIIFNLEY